MLRSWFRQWVYLPLASGWRYRAWRRCDHICEWTYPYGFVPEAGCPVHDP